VFDVWVIHNTETWCSPIRVLWLVSTFTHFLWYIYIYFFGWITSNSEVCNSRSYTFQL